MGHNAESIDLLLKSASNAELLAFESAQRLLASECKQGAAYHQRQADKARAEINRRKR